MTTTPVAGLVSQTPASAGVPVAVIAPNQLGGYIVNPLTAVDQGIPNAEVLYVNQVGNAVLTANGTTIALQPGQSYTVIPNTTTGVSAASATPSHKFTAVMWS
jgi:hypothetical protein